MKTVQATVWFTFDVPDDFNPEIACVSVPAQYVTLTYLLSGFPTVSERCNEYETVNIEDVEE